MDPSASAFSEIQLIDSDNDGVFDDVRLLTDSDLIAGGFPEVWSDDFVNHRGFGFPYE